MVTTKLFLVVREKLKTCLSNITFFNVRQFRACLDSITFDALLPLPNHARTHTVTNEPEAVRIPTFILRSFRKYYGIFGTPIEHNATSKSKQLF